MSMEVQETANPESEATIVQDQIASEEAEAKKDADLLAKAEAIQAASAIETEKQDTGEGGETKPLAEEKREATSPEAGEDVVEKRSPELDRGILTRALQAGFDQESAKRFHDAGLLEEALLAHDRRLISQFGAAGNVPPTAGAPPPPPMTPPPGQPTGDDRTGQAAPPPLSAEEYGEEIVKRDAWQQQQIQQLTTQVNQLRQVSQGFQDQRSQAFENWFEEQIERLDKPELFGRGSLDSLPPDSSEREKRFALAHGYFGLCHAHGVNPQDCVTDFVDRGCYAAFHPEISKAQERKTLDRLRDAKGQFTTAPRPSSGGPPTEGRKTQEERDAELMKEVQGILDRPPE